MWRKGIQVVERGGANGGNLEEVAEKTAKVKLVEDTASEASDDGQEALEDLKEEANDAAKDGEDNLKEAVDQAVESGEKLEDNREEDEDKRTEEVEDAWLTRVSNTITGYWRGMGETY